MSGQGSPGARGRSYLRPGLRPWLREKARGSLLAGVRGLVLCPLSLAGSLALFIVTVLSLAMIPVLGVGLFTTPWVLALVRAHANQRRLFALDWAGLVVPVPYRPLPVEGPHGLPGAVARCMWLLRDPATWRDLVWLLADSTGGFATSLLPPVLIAYAVWGWVLPAGVWRAVSGDYWYAFIHVEGVTSALLCACLGTAFALVTLAVNPYLVRGHFLIAAALIAPTRGARLEQRVERLYETRHDAVDSSAAELRRIERDLHDGAQARLVSVGMDLGVVEALIESDPAQAKKLLAQARRNSAEALTELRDLVRGIHPPVLAERGLGDAVKALALRMPVGIEVDIALPGRFAEPVESAAYFAVSELLTNAAKHAEAERIWLDIDYREAAPSVPGSLAAGCAALCVAVTDDGRGGVDMAKGSGMAGIERRLGPFDGILAVSSPRGGPTMVTMEIPCAPVSCAPVS